MSAVPGVEGRPVAFPCPLELEGFAGKAAGVAAQVVPVGLRLTTVVPTLKARKLLPSHTNWRQLPAVWIARCVHVRKSVEV